MTNSPNNKTATKIAAVGVVIALIGLIISIVSASRANATPPKKETATITWVIPGSTGQVTFPQYLPGQPGAAGGGYCQVDVYKQYNDEHKAKLADILSDGRLDSAKEDGPLYLSHTIVKPGVGACPPLPTEEPTSTPTPTPSPTDEPEPSPSVTPTPTPTSSPEPTPEPTVTPSATPTPEPSGTPTPQPSGTPSSSPEPSVTATSPAPSPEPSPSSTTSAPIPLPDLPPASNSAGSATSSVPMDRLAATGPEQVALLGSIALAAIIGGTMLVRRTRRQA